MMTALKTEAAKTVEAKAAEISRLAADLAAKQAAEAEASRELLEISVEKNKAEEKILQLGTVNMEQAEKCRDLEAARDLLLSAKVELQSQLEQTQSAVERAQQDKEALKADSEEQQRKWVAQKSEWDRDRVSSRSSLLLLLSCLYIINPFWQVPNPLVELSFNRTS